MFFLQSDIRLNQLASETQINDLWESIREVEAQIDFVHGASQELRFMLGREGWASMVDRLADAYSVNYEAAIEPEVPIGDDLLERMGSEAFLKEQLALYPWLVVMMMVDFLNLDVVLGGHRPSEES
ncbi:hypothetical protein D3C80_1523640 [compost metagenome]